MHTKVIAGVVVSAVVLLGCLALSWDGTATAADHGDAPLVSNDQGADIADVYAWHDANAGILTTIVTYGGGAASLPLYDVDLLYTIHIDTNADQTAEHEIEVRFGQDASGNWGVQAMNVPGSTVPLSGAVDTIITGAGVTKLFAGLRDDPFFFDLQGFQDTLASGTLSFDNTRDSFAGRNIMAIALEMPLDLGTQASPMSVWATTGRK